jgi:hypothetical protein
VLALLPVCRCAAVVMGRRVRSITRVSVERVVAGPGIPRIYEYLCKLNPSQVNAAVTEALKTADERKDDPSAIIARFAMPKDPSAVPDDLCVQAIDTFVDAYGAEAGNMALRTLPFGGLYIAGGIAPKIMSAIEKSFYRSLTAKGRMKDLLHGIPVHVVLHKNVGLMGAQVICRRFLKKGRHSPDCSLLTAHSTATDRTRERVRCDVWCGVVLCCRRCRGRWFGRSVALVYGRVGAQRRRRCCCRGCCHRQRLRRSGSAPLRCE